MNDLIQANKTEEVNVEELDHPAWESANPVLITHYWSGELAPQSRQAEAKLLWTSTALLAQFTCNQYEPLIVSTTPVLSTKTIRLWDHDVCELFLLPKQTEPEQYFEFEAAPTGEWLDLRLTNTSEGRDTDWAFNSGMTTSSRVDLQKVVTAIRVPWSEFLNRPEPGDEWRVNLCRCVGPAESRGYLAWQPTLTEVPNFHVTSCFGRLLFT